MATTTIAQLQEALSLNDDDLFLVDQNGEGKKIKSSSMRSVFTPEVMTGATSSSPGTSGTVPTPQAGDENKVLKGDGTWGGVTGLIFGSTIFSLIPLAEAGLHLLDGSLLTVGGIYDEAITKISALKSSNLNLFTTEENWQQSVTTYGACGKFVYTEGVSLRLPKVTGFVEGTLDSGALGDLVEAGLPNITGGLGFGGYRGTNGDHQNAWQGAGYESAFTPGIGPSSNAAWGTVTTKFDAGRSNSLYGKSNTVQPQAIKGYLYIVLATSTKTNVQVNIDKIATDTNGKAGVDLANVNDAGKAVMASMAMPCNQYVDLTLTDSGSEYTAPNDGWVLLWRILSANDGLIGLYGNMKSIYSGDANEEACVFIPVRKGDKFRVYYRSIRSGSENDQFRFYYSEGSKQQ